MVRTTNLAILTALGALVTGCAQGNPELAAKHNPTLYSVHQPVVQRMDYAITLNADSDAVSRSEADRLKGWFESLNLGYGDHVFIDTPEGYQDTNIRRQIGRILAAYGLLLEEKRPVVLDEIPYGTFRILVSRLRAIVPGCPDWAYAALSGAPISTDSNYGCAVNTNFAAMVADPADLVLGQTGTSAGDAATASKAIKQYRDAPPTGAAGLKKSEKIGGKQ